MRDGDDRLEAMLREQPAYIDDAGFSDRVIERLPPRPSIWRRRSFLLGTATALALVVGLVILPGAQAVFAAVESLVELTRLASSGAEVTVSWSAVLVNVVLFGTVLGGAAAVARAGPRA